MAMLTARKKLVLSTKPFLLLQCRLYLRAEVRSPSQNRNQRFWRPIKHGKLQQQHAVASKVVKCQLLVTAAASSYFTIFARSPEVIT